LGECPKIHDLALRADYQQAAKSKDCFYDVEATEHLRAFIEDCDRRTELAKKRLAETQEELSAEVSSKAEKVHELSETIGKKLAQAEEAGAEGQVEESIKFMEDVEDVRKKKVSAELEYRNSMPASSYQQQKLRVCEICSAYLGIHDNDRRLADHFGGKLHLGFIKIREKLDELLKSYEERKTKRREGRIREGLPPTTNADFSYVGEGRGGLGDVAREREREDEERKGRRDRDRSRDRSRDRGDRDRDRDRDRHRDRGGDRDRDRDRHHRRRSRSKSRDRHGHRRRHKHRSRSKDRRRSRSRSKERSYRKRSRSRSREERRSKSQRSPEQDATSNHESPGEYKGNGTDSKAMEANHNADAVASAQEDTGYSGYDNQDD